MPLKTRIVLELGCNHQGDMDIATEMILDAHKLGVWGIKFQKRDIEAIPEDVKNKPRDMNNSFGLTYYEHRKALEFSLEQLEQLKLLAKRKGLMFICSAFDEKSIYDCIELECDYIKLPSQLYTNDKYKKILIEKLKKNQKIMVSTGMHNIKEIINNSWLELAEVIFHCISVYPTALRQMELSVIHELRIKSANIGYSSHEINGEGIKYAILCGANYIERHYTLSKAMKGSDHETVSSDFREMMRIIKDIEYAEILLGNYKEQLCEDEIINRKIYRGF